MRILICIMYFLFPFLITAQSNVIKIDLVRPLSFFISEKAIFKASYEHAFTKNISGHFSVENGLYDFEENFDPVSLRKAIPYKIRGLGIIPEVRYYPFGKEEAPFGWFAGIYYSHYFVKEFYHVENINFNTSGDIINSGFTLGFKHGTHTIFEYLIGYAPVQASIWNQPNEREAMDPRMDYRHKPGEVNRWRVEVSIGFAF